VIATIFFIMGGCFCLYDTLEITIRSESQPKMAVKKEREVWLKNWKTLNIIDTKGSSATMLGGGVR